MKKSKLGLNFFKKPKYYDNNFGKIKTTDINILLNRVRVNKKKEFQQRAIFSSLLLLVISSVGFFFNYF